MEPTFTTEFINNIIQITCTEHLQTPLPPNLLPNSPNYILTKKITIFQITPQIKQEPLRITKPNDILSIHVDQNIPVKYLTFQELLSTCNLKLTKLLSQNHFSSPPTLIQNFLNYLNDLFIKYDSPSINRSLWTQEFIINFNIRGDRNSLNRPGLYTDKLDFLTIIRLLIAKTRKIRKSMAIFRINDDPDKVRELAFEFDYICSDILGRKPQDQQDKEMLIDQYYFCKKNSSQSYLKKTETLKRKLQEQNLSNKRLKLEQF
jgi:hypothetical protein